MKKLMNLKQDKKGFTLIEIVIVLVIIAILAAALIPSMIGWIDDSKKKSFLTEARSAMTATQAEAATLYAAKGTIPAETFSDAANWSNIAKKTGATYDADNISWTLNADKQFETFRFDNDTYEVTWSKGSAWSEVVPSGTVTTTVASGG